MILEQIASPADVKKLNRGELELLCGELRQFLVERVSRTGGHLASNLGAVELTVAIHRLYDTSRDRLVFDVGHQCYVHKALTGRQELFATLRQFGGLSGFPKPAESVHDAFIAGHASNSVSVALGMARARTLLGEDRSIIALIGDGALTGGLAYEGLSDAGASGEPLVVVLNDNGMSIDPNVGGVADHLSRLRVRPGYYQFKKGYRAVLDRLPGGRRLYRFNHQVKSGVKRIIYPCSLFEDMGFTYLGPVDGHKIEQLCTTLSWAREMACPVLLHVRTVKGKGYKPAEIQPERSHGVAPFDPAAGGWQGLQYLLGKGVTASLQEGMALYPRHGCDYGSYPFPPIQEAIQAVHQAGGKAVLAHPRNWFHEDRPEELLAHLEALVRMGLDGVECHYPSHSPKMTALCAGFCKEKGLLITAGSDDHGAVGKEVQWIAYYMGAVKIDETELVLGDLT